MNKSWRFGVIALGGAVLLTVVLYPYLWRRGAYRSVSRWIEQGREESAIEEVERLAGSRLFRPDWTPRATMPHWNWAHLCDSRILLCPACRSTGDTWLEKAARRGQPRLVATLIQKGAVVDHKGDRGGRVLIAGVGGRSADVVAILLASGADAKASYTFGSVLHCASAFSTDPKVVEILLNAGADPNVTDARGWTPLDWATVWNTNMRRVLQARGAVEGTQRRHPLPAR